MRKNLVITQRNQRKLCGYEFLKVKGLIFKLHVDLTEGSSSLGFNSDLCVQMFTAERGFVSIVDNRFLGLGLKNGYGFEKDEVVGNLEIIFDGFEKYINEFMKH